MIEQRGAPWEDIQGKQYDGFGVCIYCGSDGGVEGLRDEHIVPYSLNGNTWIRDASCRKCEKALNPVDTHLARAVYGHFRIHAGVQTRNPKDRPTALPARFTVAGQNVDLELPIKDHPFALALPVWGDAGFLRSAAIDEQFPETYCHVYHSIPLNIRQTLDLTETEDYRIWATGRIDAPLFARGIAKIAYCHAVLRFGLKGFRRLALADLVLGKFSAVSYFVGGPLTIPPPPFARNMIHAINFSALVSQVGPESYGGLRLHLISVRLFANSTHEDHGMPIYHVVAGAPSQQRDP
jgi:hypothetical protein